MIKIKNYKLMTYQRVIKSTVESIVSVFLIILFSIKAGLIWGFVLGFLGKYFTYLNTLDDKNVFKSKEQYNDRQKENISLFRKLIEKSEQKDKFFLNAIISSDNFTKNIIFLND